MQVVQIRVGNKQDEASVRSLVSESFEELGLKLDLSGADSDLQNIEKNYFGANGVFFVAAQDKQVIALAGAGMKSETVLNLRRLIVSKTWRRQGIGKKLMQMLDIFARQMDYQSIEIDLPIACDPLMPFFSASGFIEEQRSSQGRTLRLPLFEQL